MKQKGKSKRKFIAPIIKETKDYTVRESFKSLKIQ